MHGFGLVETAPGNVPFDLPPGNRPPPQEPDDDETE
jgi:hypothetical protein